jgi:hypothetical protein
VTDRWPRGRSILLREVYLGRVWAARPVTVVEDTSTRIAVYMAPGTLWKRPVAPTGEPLRLQGPEWDLADATCTGNAALRLITPGRAHSVLVWWDPTTWEFQGWYVNLEEPMRRTSLGFDYLDQVLDIVVAPDRSWHWKDEDEFHIAKERGILTPESAAAIRAEGERVIEAIEAGAPPFSGTWQAWRPDGDWCRADLPDGWDEV